MATRDTREPSRVDLDFSNPPKDQQARDAAKMQDRCTFRLDGFGFSVTYILAGAAKSLKRTVGTIRCG